MNPRRKVFQKAEVIISVNAAKRSGKMNIKNWSAALTRMSMETFQRVVSGKM